MSQFRLMVERFQMSDAERPPAYGSPEIRLYNAVLKTFIDDALAVRKILNSCSDLNGREGFFVRRRLRQLNAELNHGHTLELCEFAGISHSKLLSTVNYILNGGH